MKNKKQTAFTLVELIVVITILAILWTIAFISLQWYSSQSRDSVRISDISSMKTWLELFNLDAGKYPLPTNETIITYSWATVWTQWYFWEQTARNVSKLDKIPTDPLNDQKYVYSTTNTRQEFQIAWVMEWDEISFSPVASSPLIRGELRGVLLWEGIANAATKTARIKISWTYNGKVLKVNTWSTTYVLAVPSIITSSWFTLETITTNNLLAYNGYKNIPYQYSGIYNLQWETGLNLVNSSKLVVFSWDISTLSNSTSSWILARKTLIQNLQLAYTWTTIKNIWEISTILLTDTNDTSTTEILSTTLVSNNLWWSVVSSSSSSSSSSTSSSWWPTPLITQTTCTSANWIWVSPANDVNIWTSQWSWFCISPRYWDWKTNGKDLDDWAWTISWNGWWNYVAGYYNWWNASSVDDAGNSYPEYGQTKKLDSEVSYNCKTLGTAGSDFDTSDTIVWRMKWLATTWNTYSQARSIDWITWLVPHTVWIYPHAIPALYIADCIDWVKDLWTTMIYTHNENTQTNITYAQYNTDVTVSTDTPSLSDTTYQNRQKYLTAWTQKTGSHLPSAMSYISTWYASASDSDWDFLTPTSRWEYQMACDNWLLTDSDQTAGERIWLSAVGYTTGSYRGRDARIVGNSGCGDQNNNNTGNRNGNIAARFVVRP